MRELLPALTGCVAKIAQWASPGGTHVFARFFARTHACLALLIFCVSAIAVEEEAHKVPALGATRCPKVHRIPLLAPANAEWKADKPIKPADDPALPFSTRFTCGHCHEHPYDEIKKGWHFNASDPKVSAGRPGEPWVWSERDIGVQLPISERGWPGTFKPEEVGLTPWGFVKRFGHHMPGGGIGENAVENSKDERWKNTQRLEINCLACHNGDTSQEMFQWYGNVSAQPNFMWASTAASGLATVSGAAPPRGAFDPFAGKAPGPVVKWDANRFNDKGEVVLNIRRESTAARCLFCHSTTEVGKDAPERWTIENDVHMTAGMLCTNCHRNGVDHDIVRGAPLSAEEAKEPDAAVEDSFTCKGCHLGDSEHAVAGRRKAPKPKHLKLPPVHFEKLSCTACHSGPMPSDTAFRVQTSRAHQLEYIGKHRLTTFDASPLIVAPVFLRGTDEKITAQKMMWPAYWGRRKGDKIAPIVPTDVLKIAEPVLAQDAPAGEAQLRSDGTRSLPLDEKKVAGILKALAADASAGAPVYICSGKMYSLNSGGTLTSEEHAAAKPYAWPLAHDVRPASQALGAKGCTDCHSGSAKLFHSEVPTETFMAGVTPAAISMTKLRGEDPVLLQVWELSWLGRPYFVILCVSVASLLSILLFVYFVRGMIALLKLRGGRE
ncbi:MAG TPA: hypothetical protein VGP72_23145 [Planctomycetota bacterium]|jgi:hypothetical protein